MNVPELKAPFSRIHSVILSHWLTPVNAGELSPEVDECGELVDAVLLGVSVVVDLDEGDIERVRLVVDSL